jgi:hypothetical protein
VKGNLATKIGAESRCPSSICSFSPPFADN